MTLFHKFKKTLLMGMVFGIVLYSMLMALQLTNTYDGLWNQNYHRSGNAELSSGRWMLFYVDKLFLGLHADPINTILTLFLFASGFVLVLDLFEREDDIFSGLLLMLFLSSTSVSSTISYRMTSFAYGLAFFLAVLSIYFTFKVKKMRLAFLSGIFLSLSLGIYQAYLSVFAMIGVSYLIFYCLNAPKKRRIWDSVLERPVRLLNSVLFGGFLYVFTLALILSWNGVSLSDYNGIGNLSFSNIIVTFPAKIVNALRAFRFYFFSNDLKLSVLQSLGIFHLFFISIIALGVYSYIESWEKWEGCRLLLILSLLSVPIMSNVYMLIIGEKLELQMTVGISLLPILALVLVLHGLPQSKRRRYLCGLMIIVLLWGNSLQVWIDQQAMHEGRSAGETMMQFVICDLKKEGFLNDHYEYYFVGVPARNRLFYTSEIFKRANGYAQVGNFWVNGSTLQLSYHGLINKVMGFKLPMSFRFYDEVKHLGDISEMPCFPEDGYIQEIGEGLIIIKISEYEPYGLININN